MFQNCAQRERGQGLVEYALILSLVAIVVVIALVAFGDSVYQSYRCLVITMEALGQSPISGVMLVDASTNQDITWVCGQNLSRSGMPSQVTFRTHSAVVASTRLALSGPVSNTRTELIPPYSLWGDTDGDYAGQSLPTGDYTLTVTAFDGDGNVLGSLTIDFTVQA